MSEDVADNTHPEPVPGRGSDLTGRIRDAARLAALRELELLDAPPDESIDRLTRLATKLLRVPVSLVSLVDADRQFFLSQQGLEGDFARARQSPLSHSFCQHAVATERPLVVEDAREHPSLADNLAVRDLDVIAYAGMPLILRDGAAVGALCAIDDKPRRWSTEELDTLSALADTVKEILDLRGELSKMGLRDRLTGLPNRTLLVAYGEELLAGLGEDGKLIAVLCAGIDNFNQVNQAFGTDSADAVLVGVAERLRESVRESDFFGRLRGDVFTLIASDIEDEEQALGVAARIRAALTDRPLTVDGTNVTLAVTVGVATGSHGVKGADLISEAADAMRRAKRHGTHVHRADAGWSAQAVEQLRLRDAFSGVLTRREISAAFQSIVELETGEPVGFETLARWEHPTLGAVGPDVFIPLAEVTGDIIALGELMLERALTEVAGWRRVGDPGLRVNVNVSPLQLEQPNLAEVVGNALARHGLPGSAVGLEITEGALLETGKIQQRNLAGVKDLGVRIVLDDFGTGYSALSYLQRFPIDVIKIDRRFVDAMTTDRTAAALVKAILAMAEGMELEIVAEGIETVEQRDLLRQLGCRFGQGYLFSRPVPADRIRSVDRRD
jgi:diguanylate cyclase (GGDEF)-like protein